MKRFLIFTVLFPPLALLVFFTPVAVDSPGFPEIGFVLWMLAYAYVITLIPAWLTAAVDWALSAKPVYVHLVAAVIVAAILAELTSRYLGVPGSLNIWLMGAIPAAVCSWLSREKQNGM